MTASNAAPMASAVASSPRMDGNGGSNSSSLSDGKAAGTTDSVIEELKALAKSMLEATNAARRRTSSIEHRNSYEALMHAIENRVNGEAGRGSAVKDAAVTGATGAAVSGDGTRYPPQQHVDPNLADTELLSAHLMEQLTDIPAELSPGSRVRQQQQLEQLQLQQQRSKAGKGRNAGGAAALAATAKADPAIEATAAAQAVRQPQPAQRAPVEVTREAIAEDAVDDDDNDADAAVVYPRQKDAAGRRTHSHSLPQEEDEDDDDGTAYDGVRAQVLFKPVNRTAYMEVLSSTWKPEGLTRRIASGDGADEKAARGGDGHRRTSRHRRDDDDESSSSIRSSSSRSGSSADGDEEDQPHKSTGGAEDDDDDEAVATVTTRNKARKAATASAASPSSSPTRSMKVYRVPAFPFGGGVTEQQARLLQRQFDACIRNGEHLHSNAAGPRVITKADFDEYRYDEVDVATTQTDLKSFTPTSPYEFVVEVEREVRFDAVKAREERRRRFKRLVHENRAPATMGTFDLRVIMDPFKTGFEEEKNFPIVPGTVIAGRYEIIQMLGKATFSRAVRCYDLHDPIYDDEEEEEEESEDVEELNEENTKDGGGASSSPRDASSKAGASTNPPAIQADKKTTKSRKLLGYGQVCLKIINNTKDFFDQALDEIRLLTLLNRQRDPDEAHIVRLIDAFYYKEHVMLVTELLRDTLYDFGKYNREEEEEFYFTVPRLRRLTRQIVEALTYVHSLNLIHTDLKPENIMFVSYSRCIVKVIDFGSSCFLSDHLSSYIQSRSYRAPEVVLGCDYDGRIDVWSLGAILVEMVTGDVLFTSDTVPEMLARIVYVCGAPFPRHMLWEGRHTSDCINKFGCIYEYGSTGEEQRERGGHGGKGDEDGDVPYCLYTPVPTMAPHTCNAPKRSKATSTSSRTPAGPYSVLREKLAAANMVDADFLSFVEACLTLDHKRRPTSAQLLEHPFIKNEQI